MHSKNIFIHIPKTGGTTINCVMNKTQWQTKPDFNYRHILYETKRSNSKDIFNPLNYDKYEAYNIFMLLRNPIDRLISEYYFIKDRSEFMSLIKPVPKNLSDYIKNKQTQNYMVGFLLGKRMYDEDLVNEDDFELVINTINNLDIHVGVFEAYAKSLSYFSSITGIKLPKHIDVKRITLNRPKLENISEETKELIKKNNALDFKLYAYCLKRFEENTKDFNAKAIQFKGDKYNYVLKYTERFNLLETGLKEKNFIHTHQQFFNDLNLYLHKHLKIKDGKTYVNLWNDYFIASMNASYTNTPLAKKLNTLDKEMDPLKKTEQICNALNHVFKGNPSNLYKQQLVFKKDSVIIKTPTNNGFISKLKSKLFS